MADRPKRNAPEIRAAALRSLAGECAAWGDGSTIDSWIEILRDVHLNDNGFEIAKDLDRAYRVTGIDAELVEILDGASSHLWQAHDDAQRAWVSANNIMPALGIGDRIKTRHGPGSVNGVDLDLGVYLVALDSEKGKYVNGGGIHVPYEDAVPLAKASPHDPRNG